MINDLLLTLIFALVFSQGVKVFVNIIVNKSFSFDDLIVTGGMPSSHSALVVSLATIIYFLE